MKEEFVSEQVAFQVWKELRTQNHNMQLVSVVEEQKLYETLCRRFGAGESTVVCVDGKKMRAWIDMTDPEPLA